MKQITTVSEYHKLLELPGKHIIKISAPWCGPCRTLKTIIDELDDEIKDLFVEINADEAEEELINILKVRNIPTVIFYNYTEEYCRKIGILKKEEILDLINDTSK
jgi:thiol-disulfide isomerase/thioredoxin